ncbi:MAG TPA: hypothetical protein VK944_01135 [Candidatus Limnocylindria bacterium]|nr:hypothetical protein [Candidatus Limnocylindria bacterium]
MKGFEPEPPPEEKRDFRSASGGDEAGRAMAWTADASSVESHPLRHDLCKR